MCKLEGGVRALRCHGRAVMDKWLSYGHREDDSPANLSTSGLGTPLMLRALLVSVAVY